MTVPSVAGQKNTLTRGGEIARGGVDPTDGLQAAATVPVPPPSASVCDCPPGWKHDPGCPLVVEGEGA